jgi:hypothetical protein
MRSFSPKSATTRGAVSTLERIADLCAEHAATAARLGILYYRLGSYEIARSYFA